MATKVWFSVKNSKTHELIFPEDKERWPKGRAKCAPFERRSQDEVLSTNSVAPGDFCRLCVKGY